MSDKNIKASDEISWVRRSSGKPGLALSTAIAVVAIIVLIVAAAGAFYFLGGNSKNSSSTTSSTCTTVYSYLVGEGQTTITLPCGSAGQSNGGGNGGGSQQSSSSSPSSTTRTSSTSTSSTSSNMLETFHGHFTWSHTTNSSGSTETFSASGTFTITIDLSQESGTGTGQGTVDDKIVGTCTGQSSTSYTFDLGGSIDTLNGNLTLGFETPNPATGSTSVSCTNSGTSTSTFGFSSVVPMVVTLQATYGASVTGTAGGIDYEITLA